MSWHILHLQHLGDRLGFCQVPQVPSCGGADEAVASEENKVYPVLSLDVGWL